MQPNLLEAALLWVAAAFGVLIGEMKNQQQDISELQNKVSKIEQGHTE